MPEDSVWDKAARVILETQAQSRFTKTPITIKNQSLQVEELAKALEADGIQVGAPSIKDYYGPPTGEYLTGPKTIQIEAHGLKPYYRDIQQTIHHEDIHALLEQAGITKPKPLDQTLLQHMIYEDPIQKALHGFVFGQRAGNPVNELPAYVGAYDPRELPDFTEGDRQRYLKQLMPTLPDKVAQTFQRLLNSFQASQQVGSPVPSLTGQ